MSESFAAALLMWYARHGRKDLPWQSPRSPYRVWVSEIMLQQTQVATVIPYFERFLLDLPNLAELAAAPLDRVLALWSGLGYYSRARNLQRAAALCVAQHGGAVPQDFAALHALPGIGRSTAGAILAQAYGQRYAILDGNARRVLCRYHGIATDPRSPLVERELWAHAEAHLPQQDLADYTQAVMDLGATLCTRSKPSCARCPLAEGCIAYREGRVAEIPARQRRPSRPERDTEMLMFLADDRRVLLERRPPTGVWAGLWSLPERATDGVVSGAPGDGYEVDAASSRYWPAVIHDFTHFRLNIRPHLVHCRPRDAVADRDDRRWCGPADLPTLALPAPVRRLVEQLFGA